MTGRMMTWCGSMLTILPVAPGKPLVRRPREHDLPRPQELVDPVLVRPSHGHLWQVSEAQSRVFVVLGQDHQDRSLKPHPEDQILGLAGRGPVETEGRSEERRVGKECRSRWSP